MNFAVTNLDERLGRKDFKAKTDFITWNVHQSKFIIYRFLTNKIELFVFHINWLYD